MLYHISASFFSFIMNSEANEQPVSEGIVDEVMVSSNNYNCLWKIYHFLKIANSDN